MLDNPRSASDVPWWRRAVVYQVYPRSFADGNGDGTGDVAGIRSRLDYLHELGIDAIWINPWYVSPLADGGYDVADYRRLNPQFGTVEEATSLIAEAHERAIRVIIDVVPNHTSDQHPWFVEALTARPGDPARSRYHFRPGRGPDGSTPPTDWMSVFGGPAWRRVSDGDWYLHLFAPEQPDLNWQDPAVADEFEAVFRFWLDRGVDGFRVDVAHALVKDPSFPDLGPEEQKVLGVVRRTGHPFWDLDEIHPINRRFRQVFDSYDDRMMVAEAWVRPESYQKYLRPDEYHQVFNFDLLEAEWNERQWRSIIEESIVRTRDVGSTPTWVLSNHDVMREATRYGLPPGTDWRTWPMEGPFDILDPVRGMRRARAAAAIMLALPGSAYLYQGEELGLPEVWDLPAEVLDDPVWERSGRSQKGRDGCRVPIPWTTDGPSLGFGSGQGWLPQPEDFGRLSVEAQTTDSRSTLELYRRVLAARRRYGVADEELEMLDMGPDVLAFRRGSGLRCVANFGETAVGLPDHSTVVVATSPEQDRTVIQPDDAVWLL